MAQRGRPKKSTDVVDTASESSEQEKRPRGRPKKEKKTVTEDSSDILKNLITEDLPESNSNKVEEEEETKVEEEEEPDDSDEEELAVTEFTHKGKKYLKAGDNTLYDVNTHEEIGMWDPEKNKIILE